MNVVDEVKDRIDIVELVGETVKLRKSGKNYTGFCPFHPNTRTPAFVVFPDTGTWRCFGACNEGGDIFTFVMKKEGWDFPEALRVLGERAGVEVHPITPERAAEAEANERLRELLELAVTFFRHQLVGTGEGEQVLAYLLQRGLTEEALEAFEIGFAPDSWDATLTHLEDKGYSAEDLKAAGLVTERETGGYYDRFRNRIMIPIRDPRSRMVGFGARVVKPGDVPKFLNSPQTVLFDKGKLLYGLDRARKAIRAEDRAVIVEGYLDVIALHQAGFENAVSPMGTALSEQQLALLKRYSRRMILALDADTAGDQATLRGLNIAREALDRELDPVFDARGLVRHEGRLDAELRIVSLPDGLDPDEVVAESKEAWTELLKGAQTVVDYVMDVASRGRDLDDAKVKADVAGQVLPLIEDVADPVERDAYRQKLARSLHVDERALMAWRPRKPARRKPAQGDKEAGGPVSALRRAGRLERFCLGLLLRRPDLIYRLDREMQSLELERLGRDDFSGTERKLVFDAVKAGLAQEEAEPESAWRLTLPAELLDLAEGLVDEAIDVDFEASRVFDAILDAFLRLRKRNLSDATSQMQFQLLAAQDAGDVSEPMETDVESIKQQVQAMVIQRARLEQALSPRNLGRAGVGPRSGALRA
jgi:DNA primase